MFLLQYTQHLNDSNKIRTHNYLVRKRTLNRPVWLNGWVFLYELSGCKLESRCCHLNSNIGLVSSKEFLDIQATIECRFTQKRVRNMIITYSQKSKFSNLDVVLDLFEMSYK